MLRSIGKQSGESVVNPTTKVVAGCRLQDPVINSQLPRYKPQKQSHCLIRVNSCKLTFEVRVSNRFLEPS